MSGAIIQAINVISIIIIGIIGLVLSNTMAMTARERNQEYAVLKTLGFKSNFITRLIVSETLLISVLGGILGLAITFPLTDAVQEYIPAGWFPVFEITPLTIGLSALAVAAVTIFASFYPILYAKSQSIVDGLRQIS
jgi:putative ABC transport system permease protein